MAKKKAKKRPAKKWKTNHKLPGEITGELNGFPLRKVRVGDLTGAPYNPRSITDQALAGLTSSVEKFGVVQPIVWNRRTRHVVGGHMRLRTLDPSSFTDVVEVDLDEDQEKTLNLSLNNPHTSGDWTIGLSEILTGLETTVPDMFSDLNLSDLHVDVPTDLSDLIDEDEEHIEDKKPEDKREQDKEVQPKSPEMRTIVLVPSEADYDEAVELLDQIMGELELKSHTETALWLLRDYYESEG